MGVDLATRYLGLSLRNPLVVSACPLSADLDMLRRLEDRGAAAAVLPSLFEEQVAESEAVVLDLAQPDGAGSDEIRTMPTHVSPVTTPESYLNLIRRAKQAVEIPIIASLNVAATGSWLRHAALIEQAGADALELNIYFVATDVDQTGADVEQRYVALVQAVREQTRLPLAVKIAPYFSSLPHLARRLVEAGADGLVLFNRFLQPDIDLDTLQVRPHLVLSSRDDLRLPLRWIAILRGRLSCSLAASSGVHVTEDALKLILAGADVTMIASALLRRGPALLETMLTEATHWLESHHIASLEQARGRLSQARCPDPAAFERANYMRALTIFP